MKNRALLSAIAACFVVAACDEKKPAAEPQKPQAAVVVPTPPEAPKAAPASSQQDAAPTQAKAARSGLKGCKKGNCKVTLRVETDKDGNCTKVSKDPDPRGVWKGDTPPPNPNPQRGVDIVWEIVGSGNWVFDAKGVDFGSNSQFGNPQPDSSKKKFTWTDKNDDSGEHTYTINLVNSQTGKKCNKDPSVVNDTDQPE